MKTWNRICKRIGFILILSSAIVIFNDIVFGDYSSANDSLFYLCITIGVCFLLFGRIEE